MKKLLLVTILLFFISCETDFEEEFNFSGLKINNNTAAAIIVFYGEEKNKSNGEPYFEQYRITVSAGSNATINLSVLEGLDSLTIVSAGTAVTYKKAVDFQNLITIN